MRWETAINRTSTGCHCWCMLNMVHDTIFNASSSICFASATQCTRRHGSAQSSSATFRTKMSEDTDSRQHPVWLRWKCNPRLMYVKVMSKNAVTPTERVHFFCRSVYKLHKLHQSQKQSDRKRGVVSYQRFYCIHKEGYRWVPVVLGIIVRYRSFHCPLPVNV